MRCESPHKPWHSFRPSNEAIIVISNGHLELVERGALGTVIKYFQPRGERAELSMHLLRPPPPPAGLECVCHICLGSEFDEKCASLLHRSCGHRNLHFILPLEGANKHNINCRLPGQAGDTR